MKGGNDYQLHYFGAIIKGYLLAEFLNLRASKTFDSFLTS
jgi:hypothetical protein